VQFTYIALLDLYRKKNEKSFLHELLLNHCIGIHDL